MLTWRRLLPLPSLFCSTRCTSGQSLQPGYYRTHPRALTLADHMYECLAVRGSGPGGQGCQSSSNKIELRVKLSELRQILDESSFEALLHQEGRCITADRELLIVSSHDHRSAAQNKASCIKRVEEMMAKASWVEPSYTAVTESTLSPRLVTATKHKRWKDSAVRKARQQIRSGKF